MRFRRLHRFSAIVLFAFIVMHLANHLALFIGTDAHIALMQTLCRIYRQPLIETLILLCVVLQVATGAWLFFKNMKQRRGLVPWAQALSGAYLAAFFMIHVSAILFGRFVLNLDTIIYYGAAGYQVPPFHFFFIPYYFLAVLAFFVHIACALYWRMRVRTKGLRTVVVGTPLVLGVLLAVFLTAALTGNIHPIDVPPEYKATYGG